jgi:hypothetical protein
MNAASPPIPSLTEHATRTGDPIEVLYRRVIAELLTTGRVVLLADMPENATSGDLPYIAFYEAERLINWSRERDFFVLDETRLVRNGFVWWPARRYRVLDISPNGQYQVSIYDFITRSDNQWAEEASEATLPQQRGGATFSEIPLVVVGALDAAVEIGEIPLLGVGHAAIASYRLDADYRHQLYMSGQDTLIISGIEKALTASLVAATLNCERERFQRR